jgi:hypothetical protein
MPITINAITQSGQGVYTNLSDSKTYFNSGISDYIGIGTTTPNHPIEIKRRGPSGNTQRQLAMGDTSAGQVLFLGTSDTTANLSEIEATTSGGTSAGSLIINRLGGAVGIGAMPTSSLTIKGNSSHTSVSESSQSGTNLTLNASTHKYFYYTRTHGGIGGDTILTASINNFKDGSEIYIFMTSDSSITSTEMHVLCSSTNTNYKNPNISGATNGSILYYGQYSTNNHTIKFLGATSELITLHLVSFGNTFYGSVISNGIS